MTGASRKAPKLRVLDKVSCIYYPIQFCKDKGKDTLALLNSESKVNAITSAYVAHLSLKVGLTNVGMQKIDGFSVATYGIVIAAFQIVNKLGRSRFFQETFLLTDISMKVVLGMFFPTLNNVNVQFAEKELIWRIYITEKAFPTPRKVEIIDQNKFAKAALDENVEAFVVHISSLKSRMTIHSAREAQLALLLAEKITVPAKYSDFANVFLENLANIFPEQIRVNEHAIE